MSPVGAREQRAGSEMSSANSSEEPIGVRSAPLSGDAITRSFSKCNLLARRACHSAISRASKLNSYQNHQGGLQREREYRHLL